MTLAQRLAVLLDWLPASGPYRHIVLEELTLVMRSQVEAWIPALCKRAGGYSSHQRDRAERAAHDAISTEVVRLSQDRNTVPSATDFYRAVFESAKRKLAAHQEGIPR